MGRTIAKATMVAGTLDILFAIGLAIYFGRGPMNMLRNVASGPIPPATEWGVAGSVLGLAVHFVLMAIIVAAFVKFAQLRPAILETPMRWGVAYGVVTYFAMNWVVLPLRFDSPLPPNSRAIENQLFAHIVLVGIPIALIAARNLRPRSIA